VYRINKLKKRQGPTNICRTIIIIMMMMIIIIIIIIIDLREIGWDGVD
jgi:hypothetical protein